MKTHSAHDIHCTMAKNHQPVIIKKTAAEWAAVTALEVLKKNEIGVNTTTGEQRHGPGHWKDIPSLGDAYAVRVATTAAITIATGLNAGDTIDGVVLAAGDLVLVKDQASASPSAPEANGVYVVGSSPARAAAFNTWNEHVGSLIVVKEGTTNAGRQYRCNVATGGTLNTTSITYTISAAGPLTLAGYKQLAANVPNKSTPVDADVIMLEDGVTGQVKYCTVAQLRTVVNV